MIAKLNQWYFSDLSKYNNYKLLHTGSENKELTFRCEFESLANRHLSHYGTILNIDLLLQIQFAAKKEVVINTTAYIDLLKILFL